MRVNDASPMEAARKKLNDFISVSDLIYLKTYPDCNGDGVVGKDTDDEHQCPTCGGRGFVPDDDDGQEEVINTRQPN